jgi:TonB family protein
MKAINNSRALAIESYGAAELKLFANKATYRGFFLTLLLISLTLLLVQILTKDIEIKTEETGPTIPPTTIQDFKIDLPDIIQRGTLLDGVDNPAVGTESIAGDYKPVDDNLVAGKDINIATFENQGNVSSTPGTASTINETFQKDDKTEPVKTLTPPVELSEDVFTFVDKEPVVDMNKLQKSIVYPQLAKQAGVQGKVLVRALISEEGKVVKAKIDFSENIMLDDAALQAVKTAGIFTPAIQDNKPVSCWVTIPISFRLR